MTLVRFENNTAPYINAENLNNNFEELAEKNVMTAINVNTVTTGYNTYDKITLEEYTKVGEKLTIENGGLKIGSGISYIKASASIIFSSVVNSTTRHHIIVRKNDGQALLGIARFNGNWESIATNEVLISVKENDIIYLYVRTQDAGGSTTDACTLTVEAIK